MNWFYTGVALMLATSAVMYVDEMLRDKPPQQPDFWEAWFKSPGVPNGRH